MFANWQNKLYCTRMCANAAKVGSQATLTARRNMSVARAGRFQFEKSNQWKGDGVGYTALHDWVYRKLGRPMACEHCKDRFSNQRTLHWANKSGTYRRVADDWMRLCVSCHKKFDLIRKQKAKKL